MEFLGLTVDTVAVELKLPLEIQKDPCGGKKHGNGRAYLSPCHSLLVPGTLPGLGCRLCY